MSNIVWTASKGWHDGPPVEVKPVLKPSTERARIAAQIHAASFKKDQEERLLFAIFGPKQKVDHA